MFMRHRVITKGISAGGVAHSVASAMGQMGIRIAARDDNWVLGDDGRALVLCQAMPISHERCHVMTVAAANDEQGVQVCDRVASHVDRIVRFD